jgi:hypothetical protein
MLSTKDCPLILVENNNGVFDFHIWFYFRLKINLKKRLFPIQKTGVFYSQ